MTEDRKLSLIFPIIIVLVLCAGIAIIAVKFWPEDAMLPRVDADDERFAQSDMRSLSTAIESYRVDFNDYPAWTTDSLRKMHWRDADEIPAVMRMESGISRNSLTTPIAYMLYMPEDPYNSTIPGNTYAYCLLGGQQIFLLWCKGPDSDYDINLDVLRDADIASDYSNPKPSSFTLDAKKVQAALIPLTYDVTNGLRSNGDIWRCSSKPGFSLHP